MRLFTLALMLFVGTSQIFSQGIEFFQGTWDEALALAKEKDKIIFVDAFAVWCGPCKRMAKNVFTQEKVGDFYNSNFINVKLDMERGEGLKFRQKYPVGAFPTLFYIDYTGEVVKQVRGAQQADPLIQLGSSVLKSIDRSGQYAEEYEKGNRNPELVYKYVQSLNKAGKSSLKVSNEYFRDDRDMTNELNIQLLFESTVAADSRIFDLFAKNYIAIGKVKGLQAVNERVLMACSKTASKAIEFQTLELLEEAKEKMEKYYPARADKFGLENDMAYFRKIGDHKSFLKSCQAYSKRIAKGNAKSLNDLAGQIQMSFGEDEKCMKMAE
ncbi:MAG: thioredoxin family protein, partial [Saprospiraceae bacterium]|nr:thioredoxin family protein [Saprospiraceae bacterium]